jgi:putative hydrolase of the HAD superfamily
MLGKELFGFKLDDTLHRFSKASGAATLATQAKISEFHRDPIEKSKKIDARVLKQKTKQAFTDGKTSDEYTG